MNSFKNQKSTFRRFLESKPVLFLIFVILVIFAWNLTGLFKKLNSIEKEKDISAQKVIELEEKKKVLEKNISDLSTEKGIEANIREKFGLVKEGEKVIVIVDDKNKEEAPVVQETEKNWWSKLKGLFK